MTPSEQLDNYAIAREVADDARETREEFRKLDKRSAELEAALAGIINHWREFGEMMVKDQTDYGLDERMEFAAKLVPDRVANAS